jgi:hypothetical protein
MRVIKLTVASPALLSPAPVLTAAANDETNDWMITFVQKNEAIPNPPGVGRCPLIGHPLADVDGRFIGYQPLNVCN